MSDGHRPNVLVIWGDDIGITNPSCYSDGLMGYRTPNIDRIADEGMRFTDSKRMETIDDEVLEHGLDFIHRQHSAGTPFFKLEACLAAGQ